MAIKSLPATIFVKLEKDEGAGIDWLNASKDADGHAEIGVKNKVGVYKLTEIREVEAVVQSRPTKGR